MYKTWVAIKKSAIRHNVTVFRKHLKSKVKLWAVVKSNAYGHGLVAFAKLADTAGVDGFCVDSVVEGVKLREADIIKPILVLGPTVSPDGFFADAVKNDITITVSTRETLARLAASRRKPNFHLKVDTGMHRQGFYPEQVSAVVRDVKRYKLQKCFTGIYTHFASAKDVNYPTFTDEQFRVFKQAVTVCERAGFTRLVRHAAATGGTLANNRYHLDAVRIGIGLYGLWPSRELEMQRGSEFKLEPVLSWHTIVSEVKMVAPGGYIGYDLTERVTKSARMAVLPIGYWHGFDRGFSSVGTVIIRGKHARVLGRVSMDLIVVDVTGIPCRQGDRATLIGKQGKAIISAADFAQIIGTTHYEAVTRINPLIERIVI
jgi:alanine racemase